MNFVNPWIVLMLVKPIFILATIVLGFWHNKALLCIGPMIIEQARTGDCSLPKPGQWNRGFGLLVLLLIPIT